MASCQITEEPHSSREQYRTIFRNTAKTEAARLSADMTEKGKKNTKLHKRSLTFKKKNSGLSDPEIEHFDYKIKTRSIR